MVLFSELQSKESKICVVGMGYVGLPLAVLLAKHFDVIGYDIDEKKIEELKQGIDRTREVHEDAVKNTSVQFTADATQIGNAQFIIVAVPTPIDESKTPDLSIVQAATKTVGAHMKEGSIVVYESTVYPGVTEDICVPLLERISNMKLGNGFTVGYSPERVNPGDKEHTIDTITKVVAASDNATAEVLEGVYGTITNTFRATSIRVAEAAKVIENTQRDLNIALMNELAIVCNRLGMSVYDVLEAAGTKWNFLPFTPGLVGGHCIGVDPYYLTYKAKEHGYTPEIILAGRGINDSMHLYIAEQIKQALLEKNISISGATINLFGITFKEDVPDVRNSKVALLYKEFQKYGATVLVYDPVANPEEVEHEYGIVLAEKESLGQADALVVAVAHKEFAALGAAELTQYTSGCVADIKHMYTKQDIEQAGLHYWSM